MSETIRESIDNFLSTNGIVFTPILIGATKRDNWDCDAWQVKFTRVGVKDAAIFDYYTGTGHRKTDRFGRTTPKNPSAADVLHSLTMDASLADDTFEGFCSSLGYDTDSRKALETYLQCQQNGQKLRPILGKDFA